jgi:hypothetical protein
VITIRVEGAVEAEAELTDVQREQLPFATVLALNGVAGHARGRVADEMSVKLHMPTRYTLASTWAKPATKTERWSMVYLKDAQGQRKYVDNRFPAMGAAFVATGLDAQRTIGHLFVGGKREWKRSEDLFRRRGILPANMAMVPGEGCPLDEYGNVPRGFLQQMIAYFDAYLDTKQNMTASTRGRFQDRAAKKGGATVRGIEYFVSKGKGQWFGRRSWKQGRNQHLPPGIWQRVRHGSLGQSFVRPILMFVKQPTYRQMLDMDALVLESVERHWKDEFERGFSIAMATAGKRGGTAAERKADFIARGRMSRGWTSL